jgi:hypothetical protein
MQRNLKRNDAIKRSSIARRSSAIKRAETSAGGNGLHSRDRNDPAWEVVSTLVNGGTDPSRLLELYYWTREPGIVELIRAYLDLPAAAQRSLGDFLLSAKPQSVTASFDAHGRLVLSRPIASAHNTSGTLHETISR